MNADARDDELGPLDTVVIAYPAGAAMTVPPLRRTAAANGAAQRFS